ncbi:Uncharacterised protein [Shigella sonnei]|nr:Uncharacterised protein [Shigella sonnei]
MINGAVNAVKSKGFGSVPRFCCLRACISPPDAEHPFKPCVGYDAQAASNGILTWQRIPYPGQEITLSVKTDNIFRQKSTPKAECAGYRQTAFCPVVNVALCFHRGRTFQPQIIPGLLLCLFACCCDFRQMVSRFQSAGQRSINVIFGLFCCAGITCGILCALSGCGCICSCACHIFRSGLSVLSCDGCILSGFLRKTLCIITGRCGCRHILRRLPCVSGCGPGTLLRLLRQLFEFLQGFRTQVNISCAQKIIQRTVR